VIKASPLARRIAREHGVDLARVPASGGKIEKADVLAYLERQQAAAAGGGVAPRLVPASPKARRLAGERGLDVAALTGSGPGGAVLAADVLAAARVAGTPGRAQPAAAPVAVPVAGTAAPEPRVAPAVAAPSAERAAVPGEAQTVGTVWRIMAERMTASWTAAPHFYLVREVTVGRLIAWRERAGKQPGPRVTYTDLLVKLAAAALVRHPGVNASWRDGAIARNPQINIGLAVAVDDGLVVPVIHGADALGIAEIAARREDVVSRAQAGRLRPADIQGGGFTISNLGMYGVDAFSAIVNPPQAAILAVGRIADRVVAVNGQPSVQPSMVLTLSCDHRAVDGARGARFLDALAELIEEPLALLA
jgi:pyruvate dehydrogenase E2 component (dihydrolipoamide acetyltransferase)